MKSYLGLNRIDDGENELTKMVVSTSVENFGLTLKTTTSALSLGASCVLRDFDLNDVPTFDDSGDELLPQNFSSSSHPVSNLRTKKRAIQFIILVFFWKFLSGTHNAFAF